MILAVSRYISLHDLSVFFNRSFICPVFGIVEQVVDFARSKCESINSLSVSLVNILVSERGLNPSTKLIKVASLLRMFDNAHCSYECSNNNLKCQLYGPFVLLIALIVLRIFSFHLLFLIP